MIRLFVALVVVIALGAVVAWAVAPVIGAVVAAVAALTALPVLVRRQET